MRSLDLQALVLVALAGGCAAGEASAGAFGPDVQDDAQVHDAGAAVEGDAGQHADDIAATHRETHNSELTQKAAFLTLAVTKSGAGAGTVTGVAGANTVVSCGADCSESFLGPTDVRLTAAPAAGSTFLGWSGACTGSLTTCTVNVGLLGADVSARFEPTQRTLSISKGGTGTGTVTGTLVGPSTAVINCGTDCSETVSHGAQITLTATAAAGSRFGSWSGACSGTSRTCTVSMTDARTATANFVRQPKVTVVLDATAEGGYVSYPVLSAQHFQFCTAARGQVITCPPQSYDLNTNISHLVKFGRFTACPGGTTGSDTCSYRLTGDVTIRARTVRRFDRPVGAL